MIRAHTAAVEALIDEVDVYVTRAPAGAELPYVVLHPDQGAATSSSIAAISDWRSWRVQTTCVGGTPEQAGWAAEKVESDLLDVAPTVSGRSCTPIGKESSLPVDRDEDVQPPVFMARDVWVFSSIPA